MVLSSHLGFSEVADLFLSSGVCLLLFRFTVIYVVVTIVDRSFKGHFCKKKDVKPWVNLIGSL